ncbi:MAG: methylated-DNA--[protein]-cysteine S-methyltransferase [Bacillota bacterium]|nr:methylated-DNA--[protein]-cysteine S-methyltransferase [Bacillota bacterium]HPZ04773.1 methylated-DNA--[protein]-cysteine S-methyltransferase [Clostridiales bacterium]HQD30781.1 methylated-DNA--[protein]-cysteine S-methyltransferase [Clostridiales bacterium]
MSVETPFAIRKSSYASVEVPFAIRDTSYASGEAAFAVRGISFAPEGAPFAIRDATFIVSETPLIREAAKQLEEYFVGKRKIFDIPLGPEGTPFQRAVWEALLEIPYGETRSYGDIAARIGNPKAARAVGMANNRNPIAVFVPCHRVIGASGKLVGYAGGVDVKKKLLELEKLNAAKHPHWER